MTTAERAFPVATIDRHEQLLRRPLAPAQALFVTVKRETLNVFAIGLKSILPGIKVANSVLALDLAASPKEHRPVRVIPALKGLAARLLENVEESPWQFGIALAQFPFERQHVHDGEVALLPKVALFLNCRIGEKSARVRVSFEKGTRDARNEQGVNGSVNELAFDLLHVLCALKLDILRQLYADDIFSRRHPGNGLPRYAVEVMQIALCADT